MKNARKSFWSFLQLCKYKFFSFPSCFHRHAVYTDAIARNWPQAWIKSFENLTDMSVKIFRERKEKIKPNCVFCSHEKCLRGFWMSPKPKELVILTYLYERIMGWRRSIIRGKIWRLQNHYSLIKIGSEPTILFSAWNSS